jgi:hypothetical protein
MSERITVIHAPRDSEHTYFAIRRAVPQDKRLTFEARGVLSYLLSKPDDWVVRIQDLMREGDCGRDRIYRILKELKDNGYLHREQVHKPDGKFEWGPYRVYEIPFTDFQEVVEAQQKDTKPFTEKPYTEKPDTGKPYTENTYVYKEERSTDKRFLQNQECVSESVPATAREDTRTPKSKRIESPPHTHSPAVLLYFETYPNERLSKGQIAEIDRRITGDLPIFKQALDYWSANGFTAQRVGKICDRYDETRAGVHRTNGHGPAPPDQRPPLARYVPSTEPRGTPEEMAAAARKLNPFAKPKAENTT